MTESPSQFVSLYSEALLLLVPLNEVAKDVFLVLCKHVDVLGFCHPGDDTIGRLSCHRRDAIPGALECLQAANYIHIIETPVPYRTEALRDIQISPYIMRLRAEFHPTAVQRWESFRVERAGESYSASNENRSPSITFPSSDRGSINLPSSDRGSITYGENDRQPDQIQNKIKNQIENQLQNQHHPSATTFRRNTSASADQAQPPFEEEGQKPGQGQPPKTDGDESTRREPTSSASAVPSSAAPPPREPANLLHFKSPLPSLEYEDMAMDLMRAAPDLSRENARMLVDTYGWECVGQVIQLFYKTRAVEQPASWIRAMLRKTNRERVTGGMKQ